MIIFAVMFGLVGLGALLYFEAKIIGLVCTGLAAMFLILNFIGTQEASSQQAKATKVRDSAEFDRDFARVQGINTAEEMKTLDKRVEVGIKEEIAETAAADEAFKVSKESRDALAKKLSMEDAPPPVAMKNAKPMKTLGAN